MKILMLTSSYPKFRGDVTAPFIESIATRIAAQGHHVHVVLPEHRELRRAAIEDGVHFHAYRYAPRASWTQWGYAESLRADVNIKRGMYALAPFAALSSSAMLHGLTAREKFDVVHAHWVIPNAPMAALVTTERRLPLVVSLHGSDVFVAEKWKLLGAVARWCFRRARAITACSDDLLGRALLLGAQEKKSYLIPYGADLKAFHADVRAVARVRARLNLRPDDFVILAVGRLVYKKGFEFLVQAMPDVLRDAPNARLVFAGDGDLREELARRAERLGLNSHVLFAGKVPREEIPAYFGAADLVAVPSVRDDAGNVDGLPNVALEAMAAGKPLIASRVAGLREVIHDGENGVLVEQRAPDQLARAILTLARDADLRARLGAAGKRDVREVLNWDNVARKFIGVYESVSS
jgi:glycosyltransferase involved in cell wall biosynthesis